MGKKTFASQASLRNEALQVHVLPRSKKNEIIGFQADGRLRIRLNAVPEGGKANAALVKFLAGLAQVPVSQVQIISGTTSQDKLVRFEGLDRQAVISRLLAASG